MSRSSRRSPAGPGRRTPSALRPSERARHADPTRLLAYTVMRAIADGAYANLELPAQLRRERISGRDAAFATELVYGATRMRGWYDAVIARCAGRDLSAIDPDVLDTLRLGAHQLLGMRVASHAAVDQAVALARQVHGAGAAGFVNAVLRRISEKDNATWQDILTRGLTPLAAAALIHSHPEWVVRALRTALLGHGAATPETVTTQLTRLLVADNEPPPVTLVARPGLSQRAELLDRGATPGRLSPIAAVLAAGGDPAAFPAVRTGRAAVQDEGSQLVTLAFAEAAAAAAAAPSQDQRRSEPAFTEPAWLDLCAGPGGKAGVLAGLAAEAGATLFANEISPHRADLVRSSLAGAVDAGIEVMIGVGDGRSIGEEEPGRYERVLLDAPCTGLGALRRRPEARWRRSPDDVAALTGHQAALLDSAIRATRPGGVVGYATCSPHLAETRFLVKDVLARHPGVEPLDAQRLVRQVALSPVTDLGEPPFVQLWPHLHHTDAMFLAVLRLPG